LSSSYDACELSAVCDYIVPSCCDGVIKRPLRSEDALAVAIHDMFSVGFSCDGHHPCHDLATASQLQVSPQRHGLLQGDLLGHAANRSCLAAYFQPVLQAVPCGVLNDASNPTGFVLRAHPTFA
jgi:hypothetical protein